MPLQVNGAGLGRTGTKTLQTALIDLGFGPCHHMTEVFAHPETMTFWYRAARGEAVDWEAGLAGYNSSVDWPSAHFYKELAERYPAAKVILTRRDPQRWYESMVDTIFKVMLERAAPDRNSDGDFRFSQIIVAEKTFGWDFSRDAAIAAFERHNAEVIHSIPPERLLVFEAAMGWAPLWGFLGVPVPATPFPRTNDRVEFWEHARPAPLGAATD